MVCPLAIESAAARAIALTPADAAAATRSPVRRHWRRTRRARWTPRDVTGSHRLVVAICLTPPSSVLLARLSRLSGDRTLDAIEEVCSGHLVDRQCSAGSGHRARFPGSLVIAEGRAHGHALPTAGDHPPIQRGTARGLRARPRPFEAAGTQFYAELFGSDAALAATRGSERHRSL